jgi:fructoselysine 6-phosphate deglycase
VTNGTYNPETAVTDIPDTYRSAGEHALSLWPEIDAFVSGMPSLRRVFWVGAGGSYVGLQAAQYQLDRKGLTPSVAINSDEFFFRAPPSVGADTLVITLSGTGQTPETVQAAEWAVSRGASVAAVTLKADGPLAQALDTAFVAQSGEGNQILLQLVALAILKRDGVAVDAELAALRALPAALEAAVHAFEPRAAAIAEDMKDVPVTYLMASGPLIGPGNTFTSCFLQEMQWMHAQTINSDEFFQGPFEVFDTNTKSFLFLGEDETRPMGERVLRFLEQYSGETVVLDGRDLELPGIAADQRALVAPVVFYSLMFRLAAHYAATRGYALEGRRYMWQFAY